ncbi:bacterial low temperature requirement A protein-domain-containing protein [Rhexocercosporidium sp. MPI-PUGE-AT-0058]|nr:bacterial low temperature requirement A protein-domain-containing protein [Rhexocercosporidium sp. MPI-PUGE-AT-0058]
MGHQKSLDGFTKIVDEPLDDELSKGAHILRRRQLENLPIFGELVEHADAYELRYHEHEDARNIELFFDLFFVAIFSTFTKNHEINSLQALSSYAVYFGVIWASWLQVCLYDVRFGFDSISERCTKAVQMVMFIGFASASGCLQLGPDAPIKKKAALSGFESLNMLMIISRALFSLQYLGAFFLVGRKHKPAKVPLLIISSMYAFVSAIYALLFKFVLLDNGKEESFYGYYAIIAVELATMSLVAYRYECVSFKDTHLHKRLMVLTLMILGEGIIVCAFSFAKISSKSGWSPNSFGQALCVILSIYFIYCLYFGNSGIELAREFKAAKQQIYTMLHLPFHLSLALTLEGLRTWTIIANVQYNFKKVGGYLDKAIGETPNVYRLSELSAAQGTKIVSVVNKTIIDFGFDDTDSWPLMQTALTKLNLAWQDDAATIAAPVLGDSPQTKNSVLKFYWEELIALVQNEQFAANSLAIPEVQLKAAKGSGTAEMAAYFEVFKMIFIYFFTSTALVMILLSVFRRMSIGPMDRYDTIMINVRIVMGLMLGLLGLMGLMNSKINSYIDSGVLLPTFIFVLIFVVSLEKGLTVFAIKTTTRHIPISQEPSKN